MTSSTIVSPSSGTRRRTAPSASGVPRKPAVGAVLGLVALHVVGGGARVVGVAVGDQLLERLGVAGGALGLEDRALVPVELQPAQGVEDLLDVLRGRALAVGIFDPQHERAGARAVVA